MRHWKSMPTWFRGLALGVLLLALPCPAAAEQTINGTLRDGGDHQVLHVWGTHYEMGYAGLLRCRLGGRRSAS